MCEITRNEWEGLDRRVNNLSQEVYSMQATLEKLCKDERELTDKFNNTLVKLEGKLASLEERIKGQGVAQWIATGGIVLILVLLIVVLL